MKSPLSRNNRFSSFRFSPRSPVSPLSPQASRFTNNQEQSLSICHSGSNSSRGTPSPHEKDHTSVGVRVVDSDDINALQTPRALPTPGLSPITPWHATFRRHAASTDQEHAYLRRTTHLRYMRLVLSILLLGSAATLVALESDIVSRYNQSHFPNVWHLSLWPTDLNLVPTLLSLVTGCVTALLAVVAIVALIIPRPNPRPKLNNLSFSLLCVVATSLSLASLIYSAAVSPAAVFSSFVSSTLTSLLSTTGPSTTVGLTPNGAGSHPKRETIQSFTCTIANTAKAFNQDATTLQLPTMSDTKDIIPTDFVRLCTESRASLAVAIVLLGIATIGLFVAASNWAAERKIERLRGEREVIASRHGSRDGKIGHGGVPESMVAAQGEKRAENFV